MPYREERELVIRLHLSAEFGEDYEGEDDGYEWYRAFDQRVRPALVRELIKVLVEARVSAREPGTADAAYRITPINRGLDAHEELELAVEHIVK